MVLRTMHLWQGQQWRVRLGRCLKAPSTPRISVSPAGSARYICCALHGSRHGNTVRQRQVSQVTCAGTSCLVRLLQCEAHRVGGGISELHMASEGVSPVAMLELPTGRCKHNEDVLVA